MNGIHDMGGMHGFGPIDIERDEPLFHAAWEGRVVGLAEIVEYERRLYNIDEFRFGIEQMQPTDYLRSSYFERWLATIEFNLIRKGVLTRAELDGRLEQLQRDPRPTLPSASTGAPPSAERHDAPAPAPSACSPRFAIGDAVATRAFHPYHHTRLPRYARSKQGVINRVHGAWILPDTHADGLDPELQMCYNVRFTALELWGESAEPFQTVSIDLWESYLEPA